MDVMTMSHKADLAPRNTPGLSAHEAHLVENQ